MAVYYFCSDQKILAYTANNNFWVAAQLSWLERQVSDRKTAGSMPVLELNANYLTGTLRGVKD